MSIVLLRKLTRKSIIGFGDYRDLTVQNLLDMQNHKGLLEIYYFCRNVDFMPDILEELFITGERLIDKKATQEERIKRIYYSYIGKCMYHIIEQKDEIHGKNNMIGIRRKNKTQRLNNQRCNENSLNRTVFSKAANKSRNQW
jgi:hypothetical protein